MKKILSLVLCLAVMLSVMVVGAGAAFSDQEQIENTEAVDACVALNIISGYPDGTYKPEGNITRGEMCKMICVALNGGKEPKLSTSATPSFTDINGNWAQAYIESCYTQEIVSGVGGGKFNPNGSVTGSQAAKMLLIALGYDADQEGFNGASWDVNVNVRASSKGLYEGLETMEPSAPLTRDNAAQMIWNALDAYEVEYKYNLVTDENGQISSKLVLQDKVVGDTNDKITLLEDKYEAKTNLGVLTEIDSDNLKIVMSAEDQEDSDTLKEEFKDVSNDYSALLGQHVKVLFKNDTSATVLGVYATDNNEVVINTTASALDTVSNETKIKVGSTKYSVDTTDGMSIVTVTVEDGDPVIKTDTAVKTAADIANKIDAVNDNDMAVTVISNDGNSKIDTIVIYEAAFAKLTATNNSSVSYKLVADDMKGNTSGSAVKLDLLSDEPVIYSGYEKDDYVFVSADLYNDCVVIEKADTVTASCDAFKSDSIKLNGAWYDYIIGGGNSFTAKTNKDYTAYVYGSYAYYLDGVSGVGGNVDVLLVKTVGDYKSLDSGVETKAYFDTSSTQVINVTAVITPKAGFDLDDYDYDDLDDAAATTTAFTKSSGSSMSLSKGTMYAYLQDGSDYILIALNDNFTAGDIQTTMKAEYKDSSETVNGMEVEDDAQVYIRYKDGDYKIITGETLTTYKDLKGLDNGNSVTLYDDDDNVVAVYIDINGQSISTTDTLYGVVKGVSKQPASDGDGNVVYLDLITADGRKQDVETEETSMTKFHKGQIISFTGTYEKANDDIEIVSGKTNDDFANGDMMGYIAISSYSDSSQLIRAYQGLKYGSLTAALNIDAGKIVSDSSVIYINEDDYLYEEGTPSKADAIENDKGETIGYYANAFVIVNDDNEIELLVYETDNNRIKDGSNAEIAMSF